MFGIKKLRAKVNDLLKMNRELEMKPIRYAQKLNHTSNTWTLIDRKEGLIVGHSAKPKPGYEVVKGDIINCWSP